MRVAGTGCRRTESGYNTLFRWFVRLGMDDAAWDHDTYVQNRNVAH